jgi:regulator of RNase E activity RraA
MNTPIDIGNANFVECDFVVSDAREIVIEVSDGTVLRYKVAIVSVKKSDKLDELGKPIYAVASVANVTVSTASEGKK